MFGFTRLTPEEKQDLLKKKRVQELHTLLHRETEVRQESLRKSEMYRDELESLTR